MSPSEILVVIGGLVVGYGLISWLIARSASRAASGPVDSEWIRAHWYDVLGVRPNASIDDIKAAYAGKARQYEAAHVDGLAPELRASALRKSQELSLAYTWALESAARSTMERSGR